MRFAGNKVVKVQITPYAAFDEGTMIFKRLIIYGDFAKDRASYFVRGEVFNE